MSTTPQARSKIVDMFCRDNNLSGVSILARTELLIADTAAPYYLFVGCLYSSGLSISGNSIDGLLVQLAKRMYGVAAGALALLSLHKLQQAEILSRTLMESALSLRYILKENSAERLIQYFEYYIGKEREQNRKWQKELESVTRSRKADHEALIRDKDASLDRYEKFVEYFASEIGALCPSKKGWPNFFGVCAALNKAVDYRTVYMAMCSQSHSDPEDIINAFMAGCVRGSEKFTAMHEREKNNFSIYLVLCSALYYLECLTNLGNKYGFYSVAHQSSKSHSAIMALAEEVSVDGFLGNRLDGWIT
jgi:hypothetical protein